MDIFPTKWTTTCLILIFIVILQIIFIGNQISTKCDLKNFFEISTSTKFQDFYKLERRLPKILIIGVRKGGTRALLDAMALHPKIKAARREIHFFDHNETYFLGYDWYKSQMPFSSEKEFTVEKTPGYFSSILAPKRVYDLNPKMKLILILRNPIIRTISDFTQVLTTKIEKNKTLPTFESVAFLTNSTKINLDYKPIRNSIYSEYLRNWLEYFPLKQFLFLDGDKFIKNPLSQLRKIENFFNISHSITEDQLVYNSFKGFYCFKKREKRTARCLGTSKGRPHIPISSLTRKMLAKNFRKYNEKLFKMINQRFDWN